MISIKKLFLQKYWYITWALISSIFIPLGIVIVILNATTDSKVGYIFLVGEFIAPMLFGVYLANKEKYKINFIKFLFIFVVLVSSVLLLGRLAMLLSPLLIIILMWIIKIEKKVQKWAFGSIVLYMFSGTPGLFALIYFHMEISGLVLLYISKGAIYGKIMQMIYEKVITK
jgi:hypothetical protein